MDGNKLFLSISKLIERRVKAVLEIYIQMNASISEKKWGLIYGRSTRSALLQVVDDWQRALDQGNEVCVMFFDISKAFDTMPHLPLLHKLIEIGTDPYSYLVGRSQCVCVCRWVHLQQVVCPLWCSTRLCA